VVAVEVVVVGEERFAAVFVCQVPVELHHLKFELKLEFEPPKCYKIISIFTGCISKFYISKNYFFECHRFDGLKVQRV
jgi:hypothetical protein